MTQTQVDVTLLGCYLYPLYRASDPETGLHYPVHLRTVRPFSLSLYCPFEINLPKISRQLGPNCEDFPLVCLKSLPRYFTEHSIKAWHTLGGKTNTLKILFLTWPFRLLFLFVLQIFFFSFFSSEPDKFNYFPNA